MSAIFNHILTPGSSFALIPVVRVITCILIMVCSTMALYDIARIHMIVMICLALGLLGSVQWLMSIIEAGDRAAAAEGSVEKSADKPAKQAKSD
jgi:hypothetical protein